jgi:hypothetical protein
LTKIDKNQRTSPKIDENRRKLAKIAEKIDRNIDPRPQGALDREIYHDLIGHELHETTVSP